MNTAANPATNSSTPANATIPTNATNATSRDRTVSTIVDTPIGPLTLVASERGLRAVLWPDEEIGRVELDEVAPPPADGSRAATILQTAADQLDEYFDGERRTFDVPLDPIGTDFQQTAWAALRTIPYGETISYGEQAARLGDRRKARAVGAANGRNPISIIVPCHRVVGSTGALTGFAGGLDTKRWLLDHELAVRWKA
jgi:methylated-DNA-[protein]-cysteine S-methyltransferase